MRNKKTIAAFFALAAAFVMLTGMTCAPSAQTTAYNTLSSVQLTTSSAYNAYLDLVVQGKVSTNMVPVVSKDYSLFQSVWNGAVSVASSGVQSPVTPTVAAASATVLADINMAKQKVTP